ncbi:OmpA family protein [Pseudomonas sp. BJa5]|uniref:OmpA family protein n=1 Tax=Pseudomonas sp. BJa5 TaxID=2936270 RepID=UPI002559F93C|nr:OmpA family protein [Pseudomonas sp. BGr12]MDL2421706.1 OmpA family protein [Pseudomonas sp. BGr12]
MTLKLTRALWLWAGALALALVMVFPLAVGVRVAVALILVCAVALAWRWAGRIGASQGEAPALADGARWPLASYRKPVVLVCGDGLAALFGKVPDESLALRTTGQGCYVRVSNLEQLVPLVNCLEAWRPEWCGQLGVMFVVNPGEHTDRGVLVGNVRAFRCQLERQRKRGMPLPLLLVSYLEASRGAGPWFSWEAEQAVPQVREAGERLSLLDWQRQAPDAQAQSARIQACVRLNSAGAWLDEAVLAHLAPREHGPATSFVEACAISLVPELPGKAKGNLWQQWLQCRTGLIEGGQGTADSALSLPFPDALLDLLPVSAPPSRAQRVTVIGLWLFVLAGMVALASSAWQNTLLIRQVTDDLRRYSALLEHPGQAASARREEAMAVLRQDALRLDSYYRHGVPWSLGLGLYHGERLRHLLQAAIAGYREPEAVPASAPEPLRLDSLSLFGSGSAQLKPGSTKVLVNALVDIKIQPGWLVVITGHTDATGSAEQNLRLSRARAAAVHDWMRQMGDIPDSCFAVQGVGASQPVASNDSEAGRAANRRVEIRLVPTLGACMPSTAEADLQPLSHSAAFNY